MRLTISAVISRSHGGGLISHGLLSMSRQTYLLNPQTGMLKHPILASKRKNEDPENAVSHCFSPIIVVPQWGGPKISWADNNAALHAWRVTHPFGGDAIDLIHISRETSVVG